ncbi:hypothetical protein C9I57_24060 [Trinickia symbiotica]|uniref:Type I restriction endonuclease subunit M n=1 Tax=Trinickia symbiotica TaxID=863227 RepID=A0A2T3XP28_9BURK|nr:hypothetical protein [Trinickia symbiotica]PTB18258.1 hypothetical protein C9I57_24060 [Trinickia symbiotica]
MSFFASPRGVSARPLFRLGEIFATPGALALLQQTGTDVVDLLMRHVKGDWGVVCPQDARSNDRAVETGTRIVSAYELGDRRERLWIVTEADRRMTTLLLPAEY